MDQMQMVGLVRAASEFATAAVAAYADGKPHFFAVNAVAAFEGLGKAVLAKSNPALLMELRGSNLDSLLYLCDIQDTGSGPPQRLRTISAREVLDRLPRVHPTIAMPAAEIGQLIEDRNNAAHLTNAASQMSTFVPWVKTCDALLELFDIEHAMTMLDDAAARFWEDRDLVNTILEAKAAEVATRIKAKFHTARRRFAELTRGWTDQDIAQKQIQRLPDLQIRALATPGCPVCGFPAAITEGFIGGDIIDENDQVVQEDVSAWEFECGMCGLHLSGSEEFETAGVARQYYVVVDHGPNGTTRTSTPM